MRRTRQSRRGKRQTPPTQARRDVVEAEVLEALSKYPSLCLVESDEAEFIVEGVFELVREGTVFDEYEIRLHVPCDYPDSEPRLFEVGGRIRREMDLHINSDGSACYEVFECWLASTQNASLFEFIRGPVKNFFLSQTIFRLDGEWPFDQRSHGLAGLFEGVAETLGVENCPEVILTRLLVLRSWPPKGHHSCPCRSGRRFRDCHRSELSELHERISPAVAGKMYDRIASMCYELRKQQS